MCFFGSWIRRPPLTTQPQLLSPKPWPPQTILSDHHSYLDTIFTTPGHNLRKLRPSPLPHQFSTSGEEIQWKHIRYSFENRPIPSCWWVSNTEFQEMSDSTEGHAWRGPFLLLLQHNEGSICFTYESVNVKSYFRYKARQSVTLHLMFVGN